MREKENPNQRAIPAIPILISIVVGVLTVVVSNYVLMFPPFDTVTTCILLILLVWVIYFNSQMKTIQSSVNGIKNSIQGMGAITSILISSLRSTFNRLLQLPKEEKLTKESLLDVFGQPFLDFFGDTSDSLLKTVLKSSSERHEEIRRLIEEANRGVISCEDAERLRGLLEEEKRDREDEGDILGAIAIGLLLLFILGLLASLLLERRK